MVWKRWKLIDQERPDLTLVDLNMPRIDWAVGYREIRQSDENRSIPIIAITAFDIYGIQEAATEEVATNICLNQSILLSRSGYCGDILAIYKASSSIGLKLEMFAVCTQSVVNRRGPNWQYNGQVGL
ncbi:MAG: response regulator [Pyrinomonadaceae bacterium]